MIRNKIRLISVSLACLASIVPLTFVYSALFLGNRFIESGPISHIGGGKLDFAFVLFVSAVFVAVVDRFAGVGGAANKLVILVGAFFSFLLIVTVSSFVLILFWTGGAL